MKKSSVLALTSVVIATVFLSSCCSIKKMGGTFEKIEYKVTPEVLEMHADSVDVSINVKIPEKCFCKKAIVEATPILKWDGGQKEFKKETFQGEKVEDNYKVINWAGGSISYTDRISYDEAMMKSILYVSMKGTIKTKEGQIIEQEVAKGVIATPSLVMFDGRAIFAPDAFVRTTTENKTADIHFLINQSSVRPQELKAEDMDLLVKWIDEAAAAERREVKGIKLHGAASPDGDKDRNSKLADERSNATEQFLTGKFKKADEIIKKGIVTKASTAEDWEGFKTLVNASDIDDANLIIKVLQMYSDDDVREQKIKELSKVYLQLADKILPQLRKSQLNVSVDVVGFSDEELTVLADTKPDSLKPEELLHAAALTDDFNKKLKIYKDFTSIYKTDWRGPNNVGFCYLKFDKLNDAKKSFEAAKAIDNKNTTVANNLAAVAIREGDFVKANELLESAKGAGDEVSYNLGILSIKAGGTKSADIDYNEAVSYLGGDCSFNLALAKLLAGKTDDAVKSIDCSMGKCWSLDAETAKKYDAALYYLKAVAGARSGNADAIYNNLRIAIEKNPSYGNYAKKDMEFLKYLADDTFKSIVK